MEMLKESPEICWRFFRKLYYQCRDAEPSTAHRVIASWQRKCLSRPNSRFHLITSNFDGLLSKAGVENVHELHGNIHTAKCLICSKTYNMSEINLDNLPPKCECGGFFKPGIVLLNDYVQERAYDEVKNISCGMYFCIGTSGVNNHALSFMQRIKDKKMAMLVEINPCNTNLTKDMDYVLRGTAEEILPQFSYE
jgi:NAD-dependent deacetylase